MFRKLKSQINERALRTDEIDPNVVCMNNGPQGFICTLLPHHTGTHLAGIDSGCVVAEWDDSRDTDERI